MSLEENKAVVRQYIGVWDKKWEKDNWAVLDELWAADCVVRLGGQEISGRDAVKELFVAFFSGFPDLRGTVDDLIGEGDKVAARFTWWGTHRGEFEGIAPTDKGITVTGVGIYRIAGGKIAEAWVQDDGVGLMQQLGAIPSFE